MSILDSIKRSPRYQANLDWGQVRPGHLEGTVRAHIAKLEGNLEAISEFVDPTLKEKLRILIHTHDTFKREAEPGVAIKDPRSHASIARAFLSEFECDPDLLNIVQSHDEPFALWRQVQAKNRYSQARWDSLIGAVANWELFVVFLVVDGLTEGKSEEPLRWFIDELGRCMRFATDVSKMITVISERRK